MLGALEEHYGPLATTEVIHNGRGASAFVPRTKEPLILTAGRLWDEAKNVAILTRVARRIPWPVLIAGSTVSPDGAAADLSADVQWLGEVTSSRIAALMGRASVYALPARYEPFGLSVLEAALCGCALVLGDIASLREVWGDAALFVEPNDHERLRATITGLCGDSERLRAWAKRARVRALELTPRRMAARYLATYRRLRGAYTATEATACVS
jgi:glycogen synthase